MVNKKRLIDANALLQDVDSLTTLIGNPKFDTKRYWHTTGFNGGIVAAKRSIKDAPTVDAVEVVRCKDCKWFWKYKINNNYCCCRNAHNGFSQVFEVKFTENDFCSYGERREGE